MSREFGRSYLTVTGSELDTLLVPLVTLLVPLVTLPEPSVDIGGGGQQSKLLDQLTTIHWLSPLVKWMGDSAILATFVT
jgi:hypothetical protein